MPPRQKPQEGGERISRVIYNPMAFHADRAAVAEQPSMIEHLDDRMDAIEGSKQKRVIGGNCAAVTRIDSPFASV